MPIAPVLAEIGRTGGSRFATSTGRLGVTGESLRRTHAYLQAEGLVERNPGYGHPLRPEYVLTPTRPAHRPWRPRDPERPSPTARTSA